ncbi:MAG: trk/ktr system potassium uptake protein [Thermomicrobiales bacterium]|jgi:trk system potassium uptake protein TrkA|nr:trk/ktr system potassium uptake protein [Thermomicrobiales bacterium]MEA2530333.1 trk/ktr system potassium uptake protein [Thermomicrobiales bacterium]
MKVVIMGCGRVGARIASILDHNGHDVTVIDTDSRAFRRLAGDFRGQTVIGTGIDEDVLRSAGIEQASAFIAVTNGDNRNIMAAQVARNIFDVPEVVCRIYDPVREDTYRRLGLTTVCPTTTISALVLDHVIGAGDSGFTRRSEA